MEFKCFGVFLLATIALTVGGANGFVVLNAETDDDKVQVVCPYEGGELKVCDESSSVLPSDLKLDVELSTEYTCISLIYTTGWGWRKHTVSQCAKKLKDGGDLCDAIQKENTNAKDCKETPVEASSSQAPSTSTQSSDASSPSSSSSSSSPASSSSSPASSSSSSASSSSSPASSSSSSASSSSSTASSSSSSGSSSAKPASSSAKPASSSAKPASSSAKPASSSSKPASSSTQPSPSSSTEASSTTEAPSGVFCVSDSNEVVECDKDNSKLPKEIPVDSKADVSTDYTCIDVKVKTGLFHNKETEIKQCALKLSKGDLCDEIKKNKYVEECSTSEPTTTTAQPETTTQAAPSLTSSFTISTLLVLFVYYLQ